MSRDPVTLACDVGGTRIKVGLVQAGRLLARSEIPAEPQHGLARALPRLARTARRLARAHGLASADLHGFALAFPGIVDPANDRILSTPAGKFDDARQIDVRQWCRRELGCAAIVVNDANAALAGEWQRGAARRTRSAVMMTLGTGIGTSAIIDGVPLRGAHGQAGCLGGHWTLQLGGKPCPCGNRGCAETEASTWILPEQARRHPDFAGSPLARVARIDFAAVFHWAARGDRVALDLRDHALATWGAVLVSLIHAYDPECAVLGGGVLGAAEVIVPRLRRYVRRHAWTPWGQVRVRPAALGNDAGLLGVAWLLEHRA